jgi:hypothetical protein
MIAQIPILLTILSLLPCVQQSPKNTADTPGIMVHGEGFEGVIFPAEKRALDFSPKDKMNEYWTPSEADVSEAERRLLAFLQSGVLKGSERDKILKNLRTYKRQYVGLVIKGEKEVFINLFCVVDGPYWIRREVIVMDGGACFFRVQFSMKTKTFHSLQVNGYA